MAGNVLWGARAQHSGAGGQGPMAEAASCLHLILFFFPSPGTFAWSHGQTEKRLHVLAFLATGHSFMTKF